MTKKKARKAKPEPVDGLGPKDAERLRKAIRQVWAYNHARKLCLRRAVGENDIGTCEICGAKVGKLYADHIDPVGTFDPRTFIERMFLPSEKLQAVCKTCHGRKTREEAKARRLA
ncbi:MAG: HNH endonuclease [Bdellovibrionaceae bacterium]|nr:HNH endonuclease [Pseudobdellovibrionaceae bacterium]